MNIKEVSKLLGINITKLRYLEEQQLIPKIHRTSNSYREYSNSDVKTIQKVLWFQSCGILNKDIKTILYHTSRNEYNKVLTILYESQKELDKKFEELSDLRVALKLKIKHIEEK